MNKPHEPCAPEASGESGARRDGDGVSNRPSGGGGDAGRQLSAVSGQQSIGLGRVEVADLRNTVTLLALFGRAIGLGWVSDCQSDRLNFVAAAERALRVARIPGAMFIAIISRRQWHLIAENPDTDRAVARLKVHRGEGRPGFQPGVMQSRRSLDEITDEVVHG